MRLTAGNASLRCDYCRTVVIPKPTDSGVVFLEELTTGPVCPVCSIPLWNATLDRIELRACNRCGSMLVPMGSFGDLVEQLRSKAVETEIASPPDPEELKLQVACPNCRRSMDVHFYAGGGGGVIAACENCELNWLAPGDLKRIVQAPREDASSDY